MSTNSGKMSQLMFWNKQNNNNNNNNNSNNNSNSNGTNNNNNNNNSNNINSNNNNNGTSIINGDTSSTTTTTSSKSNKNKNWLHAPDALINGHIVYLVKFFGNLPVDQPKGIEVVKDAIRKLQFAQQMKKAETGTQEKFKKVEITISIDGVAVQEPRTQKILHQFPLHNISYCADEKGVKKFFSFIAKNVKSTTTNNGIGQSTGGSSGSGSTTGGSQTSEDTHECFVFISNKLASDITLTIGQAFDLAYRKYMSGVEKTDLNKAQQQITELNKAIDIYKNRLRELSSKIPKAELDALLVKLSIKDICEVPNLGNNNNNNNINSTDSNPNRSLANGNGHGNEDKLLIDTSSNALHSSTSTTSTMPPFVPAVPPRNNLPNQFTSKGDNQKMDELLLNSDSDSDFDPRADEATLDNGNGGISANTNKIGTNTNDLFGFEPSKSFGQNLFFNSNNNTNTNTNTNDSRTQNGNMVSHHSFTNELNVSPPLLAPPPKVAAPRRSTLVNNNNNNNNNNINNNIMANGNTDLFGSDPFDTNGTNIFNTKLNALSVDDFSLESLDPLRK